MKPSILAAPSAPAVDLVVCPECDATAEVEWRDVAESTGGPLEHVKLRCLRGHWFLMLAERLPRPA
ncbi:MAG TPA: hypothetical protein VFZ64_03335 [Nocardioidaceae bacterium]